MTTPVHCYFNPAVLWNCDAAHQQASKPPDTQLSGHTIAAPGQTSLFLLAGSAIGGQIGSGFVIGGAEYGARYGIAGAWYGIGCGLSHFYHCGPVPFHPHPSLCLPGRLFCPPLQRSCDPYDLYCRKYLLQRFSAGRAASGRKGHIPDIGPSGPVGVVLTAVIALVYSNAAGLWGSMAVSSIQSVIIFIGMSTALFLMMSAPCPGVLAAALPASSFHLAPFGAEFLVSMTAPIVLAKLSEPDPHSRAPPLPNPQIGQRRLSSGRTDIDPGRIHSAPAGHVRARFCFPVFPLKMYFPLCCSRAYPPPWPP